MLSHQHIIYIPGLGDRAIRNLGQKAIIELWRRVFRVKADYYLVGWAGSSDHFNQKLRGLLEYIDKLHGKGERIALVASSAGASLALHAYAKRKKTVQAVVLIVPALGDLAMVEPHILELNPTFKASLEQLSATCRMLTSVDRQKILIVKPKTDRVVALSDMNLKHAQYLHLPTKGHLWTIVAALTVHKHKLMRFINQQEISRIKS